MDRRMPSRTFVLGMVRPDGAIDAAQLYDVGDRLGFTVHQIRLVVRRLEDEGLVARRGRGRQAQLRVTAAHEERFGPEVAWLRLAYEQDAGERPWDGRWHLVAFHLEEALRAERNAFRDAIARRTGAPLGGGLYVHALDWDGSLRAVAAGLGIGRFVTWATAETLDLGGLRRPGAVAAALWPLDALAADYAAFVEQVGPSVRRRPTRDPIEELASGIAVVAWFDELAERDPLLPPELLPARWPGRRARSLLRTCAERILEARDAADVPELFSRYDEVLRDLTKSG